MVNKESLARKLRRLDQTSDAIQSLAGLMVYNHRSADECVAVWLKEFNVADPRKFLPLLYLANEVCITLLLTRCRMSSLCKLFLLVCAISCVLL